MRMRLFAPLGILLVVACSSSSTTNGSNDGGGGGSGDDAASSDDGGGSSGGDAGKGSDGSVQLGPTSATGDANGITVNVIHAYAYYDTVYSNGKTDTRGVRILLSDKDNTCSVQHYANSTYVDIDIAGDPVPVQSYTLFDSTKLPRDTGPAVVSAYSLSSSCSMTGEFGNISGAVVITAATSTHVSGTLDVAFKTGSVKGSFDAILCGAPPPSISPGSCPP